MSELSVRFDEVADALRGVFGGYATQHLPSDTPQATSLFDALVRVAGLSDYFYQFLSSHTDAEVLLASSELLQSIDEQMHTRFGQLSFSKLSLSSDFDAAIRQLRHREMARIIFRDFMRLADMVETTRDLSRLADLSINAALDYHYDLNCEKYGAPLSVSGAKQQMCVLALGKLGANELNLSSDIDLVFFYDESGQVDEGLTNQEFFLRTARQVIRSLDEIQVFGFVFRVDMRLRPYGESGALIINRNAMEKYFVEQGRDWERYAFVKARACAGDISLGESFLAWLKPFVYRKHLDFGAIESLRDMKRMINNEVARRALKHDVKLGPGGIREVEFIVQAHQLIWGGNKPQFQQRRLLEALTAITAEGLLPVEDGDMLREAYVFLRNSEHGIQGEKDKQTQKLPETDLGRERLSSVMGFTSYEDYLSRLAQHRMRVSACFAKLMGSNNAEQEILVEGNLFWVSIWNDPEAESSRQLLLNNGFDDLEKLLPVLAEMAEATKGIQDIGFDRIQKLLPILLSLSAGEVRPTETLLRLMPIVLHITRRSTYVAFLLENMDALCRLVKLCGMSPWVAERVAAHPILMYEMTDKNTSDFSFDRQTLGADLHDQLAQDASDDLEAQMDRLRQFKHAATLKVAIFELLNILPTMKASDCLTDIAELVLNKATDLAFDYLIDRHGEPCDKAGQPMGRCFAIIAYGKLGGIELAYGSDLDIVFLHDADLHGETSGEKSIANNVFFSRLGQRLIHILSSLTRFGTLYEIDVRLRPNGNKGPLVSRFSAYERYLATEAWTWELQALVRARHVAGDLVYKEKFETIRRTILAQARDAEGLRRDVASMREKMRRHLQAVSRKDTSKGRGMNLTTDKPGVEQVLVSGFDFKQGVGAIVDIEFLVQYLVLAHCHAHPELSHWTDKVRLLERLAGLGLIDETQRALLAEAYVAYRSAVHYTWLGGELSSFEELNTYRTRVVAVWDQYFTS